MRLAEEGRSLCDASMMACGMLPRAAGLPYEEWGIVEIARTAGFVVKSCTDFRPERYPGELLTHTPSLHACSAPSWVRLVSMPVVGDGGAC